MNTTLTIISILSTSLCVVLAWRNLRLSDEVEFLNAVLREQAKEWLEAKKEWAKPVSMSETQELKKKFNDFYHPKKHPAKPYGARKRYAIAEELERMNDQ